MSVAAQAVRPKTAAPAPEVRRRQQPLHGAMLSGSPRYLRANIRLGGLQDREEHEADHAASTITAGGCHQVRDPGGTHNLRAAGPAARTRSESATAGGARLRASSVHAVVDPGAEGRIRRAAAPEPDKSDGSGHLRASPAHVDPDAEGRVRRAPGHESEVGSARAMPAAGEREPEKRIRASSPPANDPAASGQMHAKPTQEAADPGGARSLRAMPARVVDPGASGRTRRMPEHEPLHHAASVDHDARHAGDADAEAAQRIETARLSGGHPLPPAVRTRLEHGFGETMEGVRVDTSHAGRSAAAAIGARAYTEGERITLGHGESEHDLKLMAHEATHVVQNRRLGARGTALVERTEIRRTPGVTVVDRRQEGAGIDRS